jgi:three-Cys-motif partner protein
MDSDDLPISVVGAWSKEKHQRLCDYIGASRAARAKYLGVGKAGATYVDLFCSYGRCQIRETGEVVDGSAVAAWKTSVQGGAPFSRVLIADLNTECVNVCRARLERAKAPVGVYEGPAKETVKKVVASLNPYGLHFAFLDPYNLQSLPFSVIESLSRLKRMDMLIHVSVQDLQRNLRRYIASPDSPVDTFAPGWRDVTDPRLPDRTVRAQIFQYWLECINKLGTHPAEGVELVTGSKNQNLYWLVLVARHDLAHGLWDKIRDPSGQGKLF